MSQDLQFIAFTVPLPFRLRYSLALRLALALPEVPERVMAAHCPPPQAGEEALALWQVAEVKSPYVDYDEPSIS
jgi:hypothetical protein